MQKKYNYKAGGDQAKAVKWQWLWIVVQWMNEWKFIDGA